MAVEPWAWRKDEGKGGGKARREKKKAKWWLSGWSRLVGSRSRSRSRVKGTRLRALIDWARWPADARANPFPCLSLHTATARTSICIPFPPILTYFCSPPKLGRPLLQPLPQSKLPFLTLLQQGPSSLSTARLGNGLGSGTVPSSDLFSLLQDQVKAVGEARNPRNGCISGYTCCAKCHVKITSQRYTHSAIVVSDEHQWKEHMLDFYCTLLFPSLSIIIRPCARRSSLVKSSCMSIAMTR